MCKISFYLLDEGRGIKHVAIGKIDGAALVAANRRFLAGFDEYFTNCEYWYSDYSKMDGADVLPQHAREIANISLHSPKQGLLLGAFAPGLLEFGMTRLWEGLADQTQWKVAVFRDYDALADWMSAETGRRIELSGGEHLVDYPGKTD